MDLGVHMLLAHEMPGVGQEARRPCEFGSFFSCADGATPGDLLKRGIYSEIAVALKGGEWRKASMALLTVALDRPGERTVGVTGLGTEASHQHTHEAGRGEKIRSSVSDGKARRSHPDSVDERPGLLRTRRRSHLEDDEGKSGGPALLLAPCVHSERRIVPHPLQATPAAARLHRPARWQPHGRMWGSTIVGASRLWLTIWLQWTR